jgi:hypothetical protein
VLKKGNIIRSFVSLILLLSVLYSSVSFADAGEWKGWESKNIVELDETGGIGLNQPFSRDSIHAQTVYGEDASQKNVPFKTQTKNRKKSGWVIGTITNSKGKPLSGALVRVGGIVNGGNLGSFETQTDAKGQYKLQVPNGYYHVNAWVFPKYQGVQTSLPLYPVDKDKVKEQFSKDGIVKDFIWKISGPMPVKRPVLAPNEYYGGVIIFNGQDINSTKVLSNPPAGSIIELIFTPVGPLIDGTKGKVITRKKKLSKSLMELHPKQEERLVFDIPIGKYKITAKVTEPNRKSRTLQVATDKTPTYGSTVSVIFQGYGVDKPYDVNGMNPIKIYLAD